MGKPSPPPAPDPRVVAGAQTAQNVGTAIAQQRLNNTNQITPFGSLTYTQTGSHTYTDPNTGDTHDIPSYTATQTLSDDQRAIHDQNQRSALNLATLGADQAGRLDGLLSRPLSMSGLPERGDPGSVRGPQMDEIGAGPRLQTSVGPAGPVQRQIGQTGDITRSYGGDFSTERRRVEDTLMERMQPGLDRDRSALEARLASQGIRVGSEAYEAAMGDLGRQTNDARMSAILGAGQEHSRLTGLEAQRAGFENSAQAQEHAQQTDRANFGNQAQGQVFQQLMARAGLGNQARQQMHQNEVGATQANNQAEVQRFNADMAREAAQTAGRNSALSERFNVRNQPINEITALMSGAQVRSPDFVNPNAAQIANTDVAGITMGAHNARMQNYQARMSNWNSIFGGLAGLGGAYLMSDRRVKTDVKKLGKTSDGLNIYKYRYKGTDQPQIGLMAQEVEKKKPDAVIEVNGLKMVNYDRALA